MGKRYSETVSQIKIKKLLMWREIYSKQEYPYKVPFNLLYEMLVVVIMWDEIQAPYNNKTLFTGLVTGGVDYGSYQSLFNFFYQA